MDKGEEKVKKKKKKRREEGRKKKKRISKVWKSSFLLWILYGFMILYGKLKP